MTSPPIDRPLISVHFPKAGGVAVLAALEAAFGKSNVLARYDCDPADPANLMWIHPAGFLSERPRSVAPFQVVHGHFPIRTYDLLPAAYRVVMLREPVDNLISIYFYWKSLYDTPLRAHAIYEFVKARRLSLLEVAEIPAMRWLMSRTYFGGFDMRKFDVIGSHAERVNYVDTVSRLLGVPLSAEIRKNVTPPSEERGNVMADTRLLSRLRDLLRDDMRFYEEHARGRRRSWISSHFFSAPRSAGAE
jgi:hypothetical protein